MPAAGLARFAMAAALALPLPVAASAPEQSPAPGPATAFAGETGDLARTLSAARLEHLFEADVAWAAFDPGGQDDPATAARMVPGRFGAEGTRRWTVFGGGGLQPSDDDNRFLIASVGHSWFLADDISLDVELHGMFHDQKRKDAWSVSTNLIFRWHYYTRPTWSLYFEGGAGLFVSTNEVPYSGTNFNFTPQLGGGVTFDIGGAQRMVVGVRWHHISNASLYSENPGRDNVMVYAGVTWGF